MTNSILSRMEYQSAYNPYNQTYYVTAILDGKDFHTLRFKKEEVYKHHTPFPYVNAEVQAKMLQVMAEEYLQKQWEVKCAPTSNMELKSRKTIISECGQLRVQESLSLMETCSPTS